MELAELYSLWLEDSYTVELAHDCDMTYAKFEDSIDVALLDRDLPDGTGDELLTDIRELELDWRVAMITGEKPTVDILEMDFEEYLCKPVTAEELRATVSRLVARTNFRDVVIEFRMLTSKKALVDTHCSSAKLIGNDEYAALEERLMELREKLTEINNSFAEPQFSQEVIHSHQTGREGE